MKSINALLIVTIFTSIFAGCVGDSTDNTTTVVEDGGPDWINDVGTNDSLWNISLEEDQWLEVKSATTVIIDFSYISGPEIYSIPSALMSADNYTLNPLFSSYSPIFGGSYSWCALLVEMPYYCYDLSNDEELYLLNWSIIYRIHEV